MARVKSLASDPLMGTLLSQALASEHGILVSTNDMRRFHQRFYKVKAILPEFSDLQCLTWHNQDEAQYALAKGALARNNRGKHKDTNELLAKLLEDLDQ